MRKLLKTLYICPRQKEANSPPNALRATSFSSLPAELITHVVRQIVQDLVIHIDTFQDVVKVFIAPDADLLSLLLTCSAVYEATKLICALRTVHIWMHENLNDTIPPLFSLPRLEDVPLMLLSSPTLLSLRGSAQTILVHAIPDWEDPYPAPAAVYETNNWFQASEMTMTTNAETLDECISWSCSDIYNLGRAFQPLLGRFVGKRKLCFKVFFHDRQCTEKWGTMPHDHVCKDRLRPFGWPLTRLGHIVNAWGWIRPRNTGDYTEDQIFGDHFSAAFPFHIVQFHKLETAAHRLGLSIEDVVSDERLWAACRQWLQLMWTTNFSVDCEGSASEDLFLRLQLDQRLPHFARELFSSWSDVAKSAFISFFTASTKDDHPNFDRGVGFLLPNLVPGSNDQSAGRAWKLNYPRDVLAFGARLYELKGTVKFKSKKQEEYREKIGEQFLVEFEDRRLSTDWYRASTVDLDAIYEDLRLQKRDLVASRNLIHWSKMLHKRYQKLCQDPNYLREGEAFHARFRQRLELTNELLERDGARRATKRLCLRPRPRPRKTW